MLDATLDWLTGMDPLPTTVRTILVYAFTLAVVRLGSKRFLGEASAFDTVVGIMLGSIMSRAITASTDVLPTLLSGALLVALHWVIATMAYHFDWLGPLVKGEPRTLIREGAVNEDSARKAGISRHDLEQALRAEGHADPSKIHLAILERDGSVSVLRRESRPRVVEVVVADGVQTVRIEIE